MIKWVRIRRHIATWKRPKPPNNVEWQQSEAIETETTDNDIEFEWATETIRHVGIVVHRCIQLMCASSFLPSIVMV